MRTLIEYKKIAIDIVEEASEYLKKNFGTIKNVTHKSIYHWGVKEDVELNKFYENEFQKITPEVSLYTEEGMKFLKKDFVWVIDPIEGTSNYRVGNPFYATQVCLLKNYEPVVSVVNAPNLNQMFTAVKNKGAYLNNNKISISKLSDIKGALISIGKGTKYEDILWYGGIMKDILTKCRTFRNFGASGLELSYTAAGMIDIYVNKGSQIYDYAPGVLMVSEAGGNVTDFNGNKWNINEDSLIATNNELISEVVDIFNI